MSQSRVLRADKYFAQAFALHQRNLLSQARLNYKQALSAFSEHFESLFMLGLITDDPVESEKLLRRAVTVNPNHSLALYNLGVVLQDLGRLPEAFDVYEKATALDPGCYEAIYNKGIISLKLNDFQNALHQFHQTLSINPQYASAYNGLGTAYFNLKKIPEAIDGYRAALNINPEFTEAWVNLGSALQNLYLFEEAMAAYDAAIAKDPDYVEGTWNKSILSLTLGDLKTGFELYETRWLRKKPTSPLRNFKKPLWLGHDSLAEKTILLHAEQGLGDTIQFCRYVSAVKRLGATVILEVPGTLLRLLEKLDGVDHLVEQYSEIPEFDYHCPLLSLPLALGVTLDNIVSSKAYLDVIPEINEKWVSRLGLRKVCRVGLVWSGSVTHENDLNRSIPLEQLAQYLPLNFEYYSLQKEYRETDLSALQSMKINDFSDLLSDMSETAALINQMDVVISVDTSVAHLAAALGKETNILLPFLPDWRWLLERNDSPWYPSVRLFRQMSDGDWTVPLKEITAYLKSSHDGFDRNRSVDL